MSEKKDGRQRRAAARHAAWGSIAAAADVDGEVPRGVSAEYAALYVETRAAIVQWMKDRSRGILGPPPGGVGVREVSR